MAKNGAIIVPFTEQAVTKESGDTMQIFQRRGEKNEMQQAISC